MTLSIPTKMSLGVGVPAVVSGVMGVSIKLLHKPELKTITKLLSDNHPEKRLLYKNYKGEGGRSNEWKTAGKSYKNKYSDVEFDPLGVLEDGKSLGGDEAPDNFMESCRSLFDTEVVDEEDDKYKLVFSYCTRPTLVSDWVWGRGNEMAFQGSGADTQIGKDLGKKYKDSNQGNEWQISDLSSHSEGQEAPQNFKKKCADEANLAQGNRNDPSVDKVFLYCSKKRTS